MENDGVEVTPVMATTLFCIDLSLCRSIRSQFWGSVSIKLTFCSMIYQDLSVIYQHDCTFPTNLISLLTCLLLSSIFQCSLCLLFMFLCPEDKCNWKQNVGSLSISFYISSVSLKHEVCFLNQGALAFFRIRDWLFRPFLKKIVKKILINQMSIRCVYSRLR